MELFSKIYGCYYQVVAKILEEAKNQPIKRKQIIEISDLYGYQESALTIVPKLILGEWALLKEEKKDYFVSKIENIEKMPFTNLQKAWIKALLSDKRIRLFLSNKDLQIIDNSLKEVEPLYQLEDFYYFDQYIDGDNYADENYRNYFQMLLLGVESWEKDSIQRLFHIFYKGKSEKETEMDVIPYRIQYSEKDNKFRINAIRILQNKDLKIVTLNMGKILGCIEIKKEKEIEINLEKLLEKQKAKEPVIIEISGQRNSLERCMLHFASYEKHTEYDEERKAYICSIYYDKQDETELLIQVLSFGPVIRVLGPESFLEQVRKRVCRQHDLLNKIL